MTAWLHGSHRLGAREASRLVRTARALREQLPATAQAVTDGLVHLSQAEVTVDSLRDLSPELPWCLGGRTEQTNGGLFCWAHHRDIEQDEWEAFHHRGRIWLRPPPE